MKKYFINVQGGTGLNVSLTQFAIKPIRIIIPDVHSVAHKIPDVGVPFEEPQQLVDDALREDLFGGQQREALRQIKPQLPRNGG